MQAHSAAQDVSHAGLRMRRDEHEILARINEGFSESLCVIDPVDGNPQAHSSENAFLKQVFQKARDQVSYRKSVPVFLVVSTGRVYTS